jgi:hypothetical protein
MLADGSDIHGKQLGQQLLGQPHGFIHHPHLNTLFTCLSGKY